MRFFAVIGMFLCSVSLVLAQADTSTFNVRVFGGVDSVAPSTPTLLTVAPLTPNQIDITWSVSTDNFVVSGYVITRGSSTLATTTLNSYSDTSVLASSTYSYSVRAFDPSLNYSTSSNILSTTTPDYPAPPPAPDSSSEGTVARIVIRDFSLVPGVSTSSISLTTPRPTVLNIRWGRSASYELGYIVNESYSKEHAILLTDLEPGTRYEYEITAETPFGLESVVKRGQFTTLEFVEVQNPSNVARFLASAVGDDVDLSWQKPLGEDVAYVRVVRSHLDFPRHPQDGAIVYQGENTSFIDVGVLSQFSPVYYTAFTYNSEGSVSSGAIAIVYAVSQTASGDTVLSDVVNNIGVPAFTSEATSSVREERFTPEMKIPELSEVYIKQNGKEFSFIASQLTLDSNQPFVVAIPARAVAGNLKSIIGTLVDPTDNRKRYSFLLRMNQDGTAYEAEIASVAVQGKSALVVEIFDYEAEIVATYQAPIEFLLVQNILDEVVFPDVVMKNSNWLLLAAVLPFIVALILLLIYRHKTEDND